MMSINSEARPQPKSEIARWKYVLSHAATAASVILYTLSLNISAVSINGETFAGTRLILYSFLETIKTPLLEMGLAANPFLFFAWALSVILFGDLALSISLVSLIFAASTFFIKYIWGGFAGGTNTVHFEAGYYLWIASIVCCFFGSLFMVFCGLKSTRWACSDQQDGDVKS